ncbi:hypothetical protein Pfo_021090 [Paulownia fortunei]|nr:hypothetical protein Pfo_021090 [Paulownia fortunei]
MNQEFLTNHHQYSLKTSVRTIISFKCVCKSWLNLLETHKFAKSRLSKSVPRLVIYQSDRYLKIFEFEDELNLEHHELHYNPVTEFDSRAFISLPHAAIGIEGSANGLHSWNRIIAPGAPLEYNCRSIGAFLNGNLHWLVADLKCSYWISCFDLETELFSTFSPPPPLRRSGRFLGGLVACGECLCLYDNTSDDEIVFWLMKEYGVEKSWTKEFVISKIPDLAGESYEVVYPIKVFKDGDIWMSWEDSCLFYYNKTKLILRIDMYETMNGKPVISPQCFTPQAFFPSKVS